MIHDSNVLRGTTSIAIGIKLWFAPQISEHWPKNRPGREEEKVTWFNRPGMVSTLIPIDGMVHEWITSSDVINIRIIESIGTEIRLSTSSNRNSPFLILSDGTIYDSISDSLGRSENS